ncbi:MAG: hypothetical protein HOB37_16995 [Rhodospirillaceae bacterium]|nr:hypothetical protein [Rhodospirillaceae bacterium]MBT3908433.1 hypothetical protein [Rhodospirillaceae bacterium]MBT5297935.1 hypothetical protein [Rhodospirillaceae bacterium]MBT5513654.1 hypothetical protein [Rhodospirillaceae bacterium]MBT6086804.1 hypothetical protein [Rhodospirillaceae bacterium]
MFFAIQTNIIQVWAMWSDLFSPIPYGDPYVAMTVPFVLIIVGFKWFFSEAADDR